MIVFPNAKINVGLNVIEKRSDGYHNIESCFLPVPWYDALEIVEAESLRFNSTGIPIPGYGNIVVEAYELIRKEFDIPPIAIHLHKNIPIGAGLGGGSSDAAFMLKLLNTKFKLGLDDRTLEQYASQLGSDCPFFIANRTKYVEGTGNEFSEVEVNLSNYYLAVIYPEIHVSTQQAYAGLVPQKAAVDLKKTLEEVPVSLWQGLVKNDFEQTALPEVLKVKEKLLNKGAIYASMSGSGSAVYGLFEEKPALTDFSEISIIKKL
jgi:4-diphosphocytidyl-2-C-methyl-D-erythritol kinase